MTRRVHVHALKKGSCLRVSDLLLSRAAAPPGRKMAVGSRSKC